MRQGPCGVKDGKAKTDEKRGAGGGGLKVVQTKFLREFNRLNSSQIHCKCLHGDFIQDIVSFSFSFPFIKKLLDF